MKNLARFAEYSMTGGLLWLSFLIFATIIFYHPNNDLSTIENVLHLWQNWVNLASTSFTPLDTNKALSSSFSSTLTTLIIILIFCSGLLLNLVSPMFCAPFEMWVFKRKVISENNAWLDNILSQYADFMHDDYAIFKNKAFFNIRDAKQFKQQQSRYNKIYLFLRSYLYTHSNSSQLELVTEDIRIWRISRALTTSLIFMSVLLNLLVFTESRFLAETFDAAMITIVIPVVLYVFSIIITATMFSRLIDNMLSQTYLIHAKMLTSSK